MQNFLFHRKDEWNGKPTAWLLKKKRRGKKKLL
jgi:hypothetical protein